jgi:hypothetical protein
MNGSAASHQFWTNQGAAYLISMPNTKDAQSTTLYAALRISIVGHANVPLLKPSMLQSMFLRHARSQDPMKKFTAVSSQESIMSMINWSSRQGPSTPCVSNLSIGRRHSSTSKRLYTHDKGCVSPGAQVGSLISFNLQ